MNVIFIRPCDSQSTLSGRRHFEQCSADAQRRSWVARGSEVPLKPQLQHHQYPDHRSIVTGVCRQVLVEQTIDEVGADDLASAQGRESVTGQRAEAIATLQPHAYRETKSM